jgi:hypothetical protein
MYCTSTRSAERIWARCLAKLEGKIELPYDLGEPFPRRSFLRPAKRQPKQPGTLLASPSATALARCPSGEAWAGQRGHRVGMPLGRSRQWHRLRTGHHEAATADIGTREQGPGEQIKTIVTAVL